MARKPVTVDQLHTTYAQPIAHAVGINPDHYTHDTAGLAALLTATARNVTNIDDAGDRIRNAAADLNTLSHTTSRQHTQTLLARVDANLYEAKTDLV